MSSQGPPWQGGSGGSQRGHPGGPPGGSRGPPGGSFGPPGSSTGSTRGPLSPTRSQGVSTGRSPSRGPEGQSSRSASRSQSRGVEDLSSRSGLRSPSRGPYAQPSGSGGQTGPGGRSGTPFVQGPGFDPARLESRAVAQQEQLKLVERRVDLPAEAYCKDPKQHPFIKRPGFNNTKNAHVVQLNQYRIDEIRADMDIYQYDVTISPEPLKPDAVFTKVWNHPTIQQGLSKTGARWLYDGRKLAWSTVRLDRDEARFKVDIDNNPKIPPEKRRPFICVVRMTTRVRLAVISAYLKGQMAWDNSVLAAMNVLDHMLRQFPSEQMVAIRRNFFSKKAVGMPLDNVVQVFKGTYSSIRMNQSIMSGGLGLGVNVDVCNTAFWIGGKTLYDYIMAYLPTQHSSIKATQSNDMAQCLRPIGSINREGTVVFKQSDPFRILRRFHKIRFNLNSGSKVRNPKDYTVARFEFGQEYGQEGANARTVTFEKDGQKTNLVNYFRGKYGINLKYPTFPVAVTPKGEQFPVELCVVKDWQRYPYKLDPDQTSKMIKIAVTRPPVRRKAIDAAARDLGWTNDPYLKAFGVKISTQFTKTNAVVLPNPEVEFANKKENPRFSGRWDLRGKRFWRSNARPLKGWSFIVVGNCIQTPAVQAFAKEFKKIYAGHGGRIEGDPVIIPNERGEPPEIVTRAYNAALHSGKRCDLIFIVLPSKDSITYERLKKSADCRYGIVSQCLQSMHVLKNQAQYHSNVAMKVNCKLGGSTCRAAPSNKGDKLAFWKDRVMQIGVDVSHAAPFSQQASMAAMSMSMDADATFFAGIAETNGLRVEILTSANIVRFMNQLARRFKEKAGAYPSHIYYFRDGVAEGQFAHVLQMEVDAIKAWFKRDGAQVPKFTVIVATKRHHIRFFPERGDKNDNPLPGTLVEREVTHPFHWDFYLCSHVAIQGTARPVHYHVILDEAKLSPDALQKMIYQQCYQYARSSTPVSLHPAIYYAHLISNRARAHDNYSSEELPRSGGKGVEVITDMMSKGMSAPGEGQAFEVEVPPLLPIGGIVGPDGKSSARLEDERHIRSTMWYI